MTSVLISRQDAMSDPTGVATIVLTITSVTNLATTSLFVKQRLINSSGTNYDVFQTVANAVDLSTYYPGSVGAPATGSTNGFFLDSTVTLTAGTSGELNDIFNETISLLEILCQQTDDLASFGTAVVYTVNSSGVTP